MKIKITILGILFSSSFLPFVPPQLGLPGNGYYPGVTRPGSMVGRGGGGSVAGSSSSHRDLMDDLLPVDFLEGCVDLAVVLPTKRIVRMDVDRK